MLLVKKANFLGVFILIFLLAAGQAAGMYVTDKLKVTLRTGPGIDHKIVGMIQSGLEVKKIKSKDGWTQVRVPGGKTGWVLDRFLTSDEPSKTALERLKKEHEALRVKSAPLFKENARLKKKNRELRSQLAEQIKKSKMLEKELLDLRQNRSFYWFFLGAGVLLLGFLIGFLSRRQKRRSYLS